MPKEEGAIPERPLRGWGLRSPVVSTWTWKTRRTSFGVALNTCQTRRLCRERGCGRCRSSAHGQRGWRAVGSPGPAVGPCRRCAHEKEDVSVSCGVCVCVCVCCFVSLYSPWLHIHTAGVYGASHTCQDLRRGSDRKDPSPPRMFQRARGGDEVTPLFSNS